ncbi:unnamed protein product [Aphanomyces euteiches]|uniref:WRKY19-like zinc finger domain-containing protein n=1 Tax=Aphanomyces euteiches TaxID=100861 RepID=A0A6G0XR28_9STRA|nr:hypothetical protein Ae201684_002451 [Aphanomyces euteiches]KAH9087362.1 hypothetical protein Ae201684P_000773 [Aphanomyces euteiches]
MNKSCFFEGCLKPVEANSWRCAFHKGRDRCSVADCRRQAYARKLCARHGGKAKCSVDGCAFRVRSMGLCAKHGVKRKPRICQEADCGKPAQAFGYCIRHGGGRRCKTPGCDTYARRGGMCCRHSRPSPTTQWQDDDDIVVKKEDPTSVESFVQLLDKDEVLNYDDDFHPVDLGILQILIEMQ